MHKHAQAVVINHLQKHKFGTVDRMVSVQNRQMTAESIRVTVIYQLTLAN